MRSCSNPQSVVTACLVMVVGWLVGCASPQTGDVSRCEQEKAQLLATIRQQRDEVDALRSQTASLERRLAQSETALARLDPDRRLRGPAPESPADDLNWRQPTELASEKDEDSARR